MRCSFGDRQTSKQAHLAVTLNPPSDGQVKRCIPVSIVHIHISIWWKKQRRILTQFVSSSSVSSHVPSEVACVSEDLK